MSRRSLSPAAACAVLIAMLLVGLWPFNPYFNAEQWKRTGEFHFHFFFPNQVQWLKGENGLNFGDYGSIFSSGEFTAIDGGGVSLEVWIEPAASEDSNLILAFYVPDNPLKFSVGQSGDALVVNHTLLDEQRLKRSSHIAVDHVFRQGQKVLITITSGGTGTSVYLNTKLARVDHGLKMTANDFKGQLVIGNSPLGNDTWGGKLKGLAFYKSELRPEDVEQHYTLWSTNGEQFPASEMADAIALYRFNERTGSVVHNSVWAEPDLYIPDRFKILRQPFLSLPWEEFENTSSYYLDLMINILGFMPLGFLLCASFSLSRLKHPALTAAVVGGIVSLMIEILQAFIPLRKSGITDIITNSTGSALGAIIYCWKPARYVASKCGF